MDEAPLACRRSSCVVLPSVLMADMVGKCLLDGRPFSFQRFGFSLSHVVSSPRVRRPTLP